VATGQDLIHFLAALPITFLFMVIYHKNFSPLLLLGIPALALIQLGYTYGIGLMISTINIFFRDAERLIGILITFLFYLTPIVYSTEMIPENFRELIPLNPVAPLILNWRSLFMEGQLNWIYLGISGAYAILFIIIGQTIYKRLSWRFAEFL
jgi:lipopolysaccharide transport system permease protein